MSTGEWVAEAASGERPLGLEEAHALGFRGPGEPVGNFDASLCVRAAYVRSAWREQVESAGPVDSRRAAGPRHDARSGGWGTACRDRLPVVALDLVPPLALVLRNRLVALVTWIVWAFARVLAGRNPFARAVAVPSRGRRGVWQRPSPSAFGCDGDPLAICAAPLGRAASCLDSTGQSPSAVIRPMYLPVSGGTTPAWEETGALVLDPSRFEGGARA